MITSNGLKDFKDHLSDCVLLGDRSYLSSTQQLDLFETENIVLETPMRINQKAIKRNLIFNRPINNIKIQIN